MKDNLNLIVLDSAQEIGEKINKHLNKIRKTEKDYRIKVVSSRFSNGEGKVTIMRSIRDADLFVLSDVGNYGITYDMRGCKQLMTPDEHFADIKRTIAAVSNHASRVSLVMPLLYESRQHKRKGRESLDCAMGLQEIEHLGIKNFVTFDAHDPSVANAVPRMAFDNFYPTSMILEKLFEQELESMKDLLVIAPDMGAMERARYYADMLGSDVGCFYKRRDLSRVVNGKAPIVEHTYLGSDMDGKNIIIVDDMIASGGSVIEVTREAKKRGANKIFICATFALFTEGIKLFDEAYEEALFTKIYSTNLTYVPDDVKEKEWYEDVDSSLMIAKIINHLHEGKSLESLHNDNKETYRNLRNLK